MNGIVKKYAIVFERALENAYVIAPFDSHDAASDYARAHCRFPQVWRVVELREPEKA